MSPDSANFHTLGNTAILELHKTAFLCSRKCPASVVLKAYDWAIARRNAGRCIISGFHSTIEKDDGNLQRLISESNKDKTSLFLS